jgi:hypothetical protein
MQLVGGSRGSHSSAKLRHGSSAGFAGDFFHLVGDMGQAEHGVRVVPEQEESSGS